MHLSQRPAFISGLRDRQRPQRHQAALPGTPLETTPFHSTSSLRPHTLVGRRQKPSYSSCSFLLQQERASHTMGEIRQEVLVLECIT